MKLAAIDVGSNAVRLLLSRVIDEGADAVSPVFKKESLVRMPIRLGDEVFSEQYISEDKAERLVETMVAFRHLIRAYDAVDFAACATSAIREARNGPKVVERINDASGIGLTIVDGRREAEIIVSNSQNYHKLDSFKTYLHVDVGGGSTEITLFSENGTIDARSFDIGTLRLLQGQVPDDRWEDLRKWLRAIRPSKTTLAGIGSGGNINKIFRLSRRKEGQPMTLKQLTDIHSMLAALSLDERIRVMGLRPDRADVIVPAAEIFMAVMKWSKFKQLFVPQIGLADGLIRILYREIRERRKSGEDVATIRNARL